MSHIKKENIQYFQEKLLRWYALNERKFDWRLEGLSTYDLIIAEILLQRTKAETVAKFYKNFLDDFPSWETLAKTDLDKIENYLKPIGLYRQRAKRLLSLAEEMVKRNGVLPANRAELESIPFFGQYIANAIELIIYDNKKPLLDVNMARVLERYFGKRKMADIRYDPYLQKLALRVANHDNSKELNWAILDFAALVCKANKPLCTICELNTRCKYYSKQNKY